MDYMARLFSQTATWNEVVPATSSLTEETIVVHVLEGIRISSETVGATKDGYGSREESGAILFYLCGSSSVDGIKDETPAFKVGDTIETPTKVWTVASVTSFANLGKGLHHMEVSLV